MAEQDNHPRMPLDHHELVDEIRELVREDRSMDKAEIKRRVMENRNLPTDMSDPYWDVLGPSHTARRTSRGSKFNGRFNMAYRIVRPKQSS